MNYEKIYKEALNKAKSKIWNDKGHVLYEDDIKEIFPELAESEDERIMKEIIKLVKYYYGSSLALKHAVSKDEMVAWLEKQGEQKSAWNKEDEQFFNTALWHISYSISNGKSTDINCDTTDWLKSLKYRIKGE